MTFDDKFDFKNFNYRKSSPLFSSKKVLDVKMRGQCDVTFMFMASTFAPCFLRYFWEGSILPLAHNTDDKNPGNVPISCWTKFVKSIELPYPYLSYLILSYLILSYSTERNTHFISNPIFDLSLELL